VAQQVALEVRRRGGDLSHQPVAQAAERTHDEQGQVGQRRVDATVVLHEVAAPRLEPVGGHPARAAVAHGDAAALAHQVNDARLGHVPALPAGALGPQQVLRLLEIEEVALVHQTELLDHVAPHQHEGAGHPVDLARLLRDAQVRAKAVEQARQRADGQVAQHLVDGIRKAEAAGLRRGVRVLAAAARGAHFGPGDHEVEQAAQRARTHHRVRVEQQQPLRTGMTLLHRADGHVVAGREAVVGWCAHQLGPGAPAPLVDGARHDVGRAVGRTVVDDHDAQPRHAGALGLDRREAVDRQRRGPVGHDRDHQPLVCRGHRVSALKVR
jgi:hypothetical protein